MLFQVDLTQVQEIKPLPAGSYVFKVIDVDGSKQSKAGNAKMVVKCEVIAPKVVQEKQKNFWLSLSLVESALFKVKQFVESCGIPVKASGFNSTDLIGKQFGAIVIEEETKEYGHRNQIQSFIKISGTGAKADYKAEVDPAAFKRFIDSFNAVSEPAAPSA
jgi:hypothetical protein